MCIARLREKPRDGSALRWAVAALSLVTILTFIPYRIAALRYQPTPDVQMHIGKAAGGRAWSEIFLLRPGAGADTQPGYHIAVAQAARLLQNPTSLALALVITGFVVWCLASLLAVWNAEAWVWGLFLTVFSTRFAGQMLSGGPSLITGIAVTCLLIWFDRRPRNWGIAALLTGLAAATDAWVSGEWYMLFPLVLATGACYKNIGARVGLGWLLGSLAAWPLLWDSLRYLAADFSGHENWSNVLRFPLLERDACAPLIIAASILHHRARGWPWTWKTPSFCVLAMTWAGGMIYPRLWETVGCPALLVWLTGMAAENLGRAKAAGIRWHTFALATAFAATALCLRASADGNGWSGRQYASGFGPKFVLPTKGVVYTLDKDFARGALFNCPMSRWRLSAGFTDQDAEPEVREALSMSHKEAQTWQANRVLARMATPEDCLVVKDKHYGPGELATNVPGFSWQFVDAHWVGKRRRQ